MTVWCQICRKPYPTRPALDEHMTRRHPDMRPPRPGRYVPPDLPVELLPLSYWDGELRFVAAQLDAARGAGINDILDTIREIRRALDTIEEGVRANAITAGPRYPDGTRCELCDSPAGLHSAQCPDVRAGTA